MLRLPSCFLNVPRKNEIRDVFKQSHALMLSYVVEPTPERPPNALLYLCTDPNYSLEKLGKNARYDVRRGLREFEIRFLEQKEVHRLGKQAYYDTLIRTGLSPKQRGNFDHAFGRPLRDKCFLGALKAGQLAAFLQIMEVNDWVSLGGYSANQFLPFCPNNALVFYAVEHYLGRQKRRVVDYGLSSIQAMSNAEGLDHFKRKMGFATTPVHRVFDVNPLVRPFVSRVTSSIVSGMLKIFPRHSMLKKADGALRLLLQP